MNDFTKEELEELNITLLGYDFENIDILNKIQSMIDNYCEHECKHMFDGKFYNLFGEECNVGNTLHFKVKCKLCGEFYK